MAPTSGSERRSRPRRGRSDEAAIRLQRAREAHARAADAARQVMDRAVLERDARWQNAARANRRRARLVMWLPLVPGVVLAALGPLSPALLIAGLVLLAGWALVALATAHAAAVGFADALGGVPPLEASRRQLISPLDAARVDDVAESLCAQLGLKTPEVRVLDDPAHNAVATGTPESGTTLLVTAGLLRALERIELEGVVAHELSHMKRLDIYSGGVSYVLFRGGRRPGTARLARWLEGPDREIEADLAAVGATRYPPGLVEALKRAETAESRTPSRSVPAPALAATARQWLLPLDSSLGPAPADEDYSFAERLEVLVEL